MVHQQWKLHHTGGWHLRQLLTTTRILRSPHYTDVDLSVHKDFQLTERFRLQFRTDFINAFNHVQHNAPNMSLGTTMGQITSAQPPRNIQLALKLYY